MPNLDAAIRVVRLFAVVQIATALFLVETAAQTLDDARKFAAEAASSHKQGRYIEEEQQYKRSLALYEKQLGPDHLETAKLLYEQGQRYIKVARQRDAVPLLKHSLAIKELKLGLNHAEVGDNLTYLGGAYQTLGRFWEAEPLYRRAVTIKEESSGKDSPSVGILLGGSYR